MIKQGHLSQALNMGVEQGGTVRVLQSRYRQIDVYKRQQLGLQVFAAPDNMTGQVQIQVRAREIDFVTTFGKNMQALLDVMGITRMIKKENGSVLKTKKVTGTLQSGEVAEGDEIPMSQYKVEAQTFDTLKIHKYRKGVSLEAIAERGYEAAVEMTDEAAVSYAHLKARW